MTETIKVYKVQITEERLLSETGWILPGGRRILVGEPVLIETREYQIPEGYQVSRDKRGEKQILSPAGRVCGMVASLAIEEDVPALADPDRKSTFRLEEVRR